MRSWDRRRWSTNFKVVYQQFQLRAPLTLHQSINHWVRLDWWSKMLGRGNQTPEGVPFEYMSLLKDLKRPALKGPWYAQGMEKSHRLKEQLTFNGRMRTYKDKIIMCFLIIFFTLWYKFKNITKVSSQWWHWHCLYYTNQMALWDSSDSGASLEGSSCSLTFLAYTLITSLAKNIEH